VLVSVGGRDWDRHGPVGLLQVAHSATDEASSDISRAVGLLIMNIVGVVRGLGGLFDHAGIPD